MISALMARYPGHPKVQHSGCTVNVRRMLPIMKLFLVSVAVVLWAGEAQVDARKQSPPLRFNKNGEFKIVQVDRNSPKPWSLKYLFIGSYPQLDLGRLQSSKLLNVFVSGRVKKYRILIQL